LPRILIRRWFGWSLCNWLSRTWAVVLIGGVFHDAIEDVTVQHVCGNSEPVSAV
jgi:hypothetical protein